MTEELRALLRKSIDASDALHCSLQPQPSAGNKGLERDLLPHCALRTSPGKMTFYDDIYPFYPLQRTSFIFSGPLLTIILVFLVLAFSFLLILPGIRGKARFLWMFRIIISLTTTNATYKSFSNAVVDAEIGLHVGLYGINVTLRGNPVMQLNETIDYNEMFSWEDSIEEEYREALERGLPNPILYIAEKFTFNSPCRLIFQYRYSGRYASATLW
ncbi:hypothetical protein CRUP_016638 [Coryphaenoides rupestris]|nr:hypothetical protein CRUP_016638 [Coryphaenoides rupestris]